MRAILRHYTWTIVFDRKSDCVVVARARNVDLASFAIVLYRIGYQVSGEDSQCCWIPEARGGPKVGVHANIAGGCQRAELLQGIAEDI